VLPVLLLSGNSLYKPPVHSKFPVYLCFQYYCLETPCINPCIFSLSCLSVLPVLLLSGNSLYKPPYIPNFLFICASSITVIEQPQTSTPQSGGAAQGRKGCCLLCLTPPRSLLYLLIFVTCTECLLLAGVVEFKL